MPRKEVPRGYRDDGRRDGCNGGGRREGGPACSGRTTARWAMARARKEAPGSRGSPCRITARGRPERDTPSDGGAREASATAPCLSGAAGASASTVDAAGTGASATHGAGAGDGAGASAGASTGLTRFLWRQRE